MTPFSISAQKIGKKFYQQWLYRDLSFTLHNGEKLAILGTNGSGKTTLLRILAGQLSPTEGKVFYTKEKNKIPYENMYQYISWAGPHTALYPDLTLAEHLKLHFSFKTPLLPIPQIIEKLNLTNEVNKKLRFYSSGMLQRAKVGIALFSNSEILILDEPTSNMDEANATYILALIEEYIGNRIYILASNLSREYIGMQTLILGGTNTSHFLYPDH